jgi:hypothetical protein
MKGHYCRVPVVAAGCLGGGEDSQPDLETVDRIPSASLSSLGTQSGEQTGCITFQIENSQGDSY